MTAKVRVFGCENLLVKLTQGGPFRLRNKYDSHHLDSTEKFKKNMSFTFNVSFLIYKNVNYTPYINIEISTIEKYSHGMENP